MGNVLEASTHYGVSDPLNIPDTTLGHQVGSSSLEMPPSLENCSPPHSRDLTRGVTPLWRGQVSHTGCLGGNSVVQFTLQRPP